MTLKEKLSKIQQEMKAPKNLYNKFGKYKYRNAEGILEAFKPYEDKYKVAMIIRDEITTAGDRVYVKAIATILDLESDDQLFSAAYAREPEEKKGMDGAQVTGTSSSYARKYALNGLLLLDDTKDPDSDEHHVESEEKAKREGDENVRSDAKRNTIEEICKKHRINPAEMCKSNGLDWKNMTEENLQWMLNSLMANFGDES